MNYEFELGEFRIEKFNPSQKEFFNACGKSRFVGFGGGWGNGKTLACCIEVLRIASLYPNNLILVGRLKGTDLEASTKKTMLEVCSGWLATGQAKLHKKENKIVLENGTEIIFRHLEDVFSSGIMGMNLGGFYIDQAEEITENVFDTLRGRLRRKSFDVDGGDAPRFGIISFNMNGHNWIWRLFKKKWDKQKKALENPEEYGLVEASTVDNQDHLPKDYLDDLLSRDPEWIARYVHGSWDVFSGQIFDDFNPEVHVIPHREPMDGSVIFAAFDPGYVDPFGGLWLAIEPGGQRYIFMEHYIPQQTTAWHANVIKAKENNRHIMCRWTDAANAQVIADLNEAGVYTIPAKKETLQSSVDHISGGITAIKNLLKTDPLTEKPGIIISDSCVNLIYEMQQYSWKARRGEMNAPEVPEGKHDHLIDPLRYILTNYAGFEAQRDHRSSRSMASSRDVIAGF